MLYDNRQILLNNLFDRKTGIPVFENWLDLEDRLYPVNVDHITGLLMDYCNVSRKAARKLAVRVVKARRARKWEN